MELVLIKVFNVIDQNYRKKITNLECLITKNKRNFEALKEEKDKIQNELMELYESQEKDLSISDQIGIIFRMAENNIEDSSISEINITKVLDKTKSFLNVGSGLLF
jgi:poly-gamma-glutamate capsule biosynthesis protein CapA/YwtB (metallophosphatase superfamily)